MSELLLLAPEQIVDIHLNSVRIGIDVDEKSRWLGEQSSNFNDSMWDAFLWAAMEETTLVENIYNYEDSPYDRAYGFRVDQAFEPVEEWRLRAIEAHLCGGYKNTPALARVFVLSDWDGVSTQAEIAELLGRSETTISEQVADAGEWRERTTWMCENRA